MTKVLVLNYSSYGHIETMADAVVEGPRATGARWAERSLRAHRSTAATR